MRRAQFLLDPEEGVEAVAAATATDGQLANQHKWGVLDPESRLARIGRAAVGASHWLELLSHNVLRCIVP
jgi:hypothetical protein